YCHGVSDYLKPRYRELRKCTSPESMDSIWGDILVHRQALQAACSNFIVAHPVLANNIAADKYLWHISYYDAIVECRKRLRLHTPLSNLSSLTTDSDSISNDGSYAQSNRTSVSDGPLEEWQRDWWTLTLQTLFKEALGFFQELLSLVAENLEMTSLEYALHVLNRPQGSRMPPAFAIARRLFICLGDIYRYQYMYLPLLHCSGMGLVDTQNILDLARWTYARARALYTDSGRACVQLALLSAYANNRFDTVFWELCSLCYDGSRAMSRASSRRGLLYVDNPTTDNDSCSEDPIEQAVIELARAIHSSQNIESVLALYNQALALLETDIAEIRDGDSLELDTDFWAREYQLSVVLAALLTLAASNTIIDTKTKHTYVAFGKESDIKLTQNAVRMELLANEALPHDVSLLGWVSLRNVQRNVHYGAIFGEQLEVFVTSETPNDSRDLALLGIWSNPTNIIHVVAARIQLLLLAAADQRLFEFMTWNQSGELKIAASSPL
ncbi:Smg-6, nonsense mediated mRNA decay factor, partial [Coemansia sp. RSA 1290]